MTSPLDALAAWPVPHAAAVVVTTDGVVDAFGPIDRVFELASVTKVLTAMTSWVAWEEGTLDLDGPAGPPGATVRDLLAHASGLAFDNDDIVAPPRHRRVYSNRGFEVLADHLASRAGLPFTTYLGEAVIGPLGLTSTTFRGSAGSGASSSVADLALVAGELLAPALVAPATLAAATSVVHPGLDGIVPGYGRQSPCDWGLGVELRDSKSPHWTSRAHSPETFGHFGRAGGFLWVDPVAGLACACLTDREFGAWAIEAWPSLSTAVLEAWPG